MAAHIVETWFLIFQLIINFRLKGHVNGQLDTSVCTPNVNDSARTLPRIADRFTARAEWKMIESRRWLYLEEFYDGPGNRAAKRLTGVFDPGKVVLYISDYGTDEYISIQDGICEITEVSQLDSYTLPFETWNSTSDQVLSIHKVLEFGTSYKERYVGPTTVRGMAALHWESCFYDNTTHTTTKVDFYFSDSSSWETPSGASMAPIRSHIHTRVGSGNHVYDKHEQYDFVYFQEFIDDFSIFSIPNGMFCKGRTSNKKPPEIPPYFSFRAEIVIPMFSSVGACDEWYDHDRKLVRIDSKPLHGGALLVPIIARREVHDFNTGVSYLLDMESDKCHVVPLSMDMFDAKFSDPNHIAIKSPQGFFDFTSVNFTYSGKTMERNINTDTFIGVRQDWPPGLNKTSYWEWYFTPSDSTLNPLEKRKPVRLKISVPDLNATYIYNMFDFTETEPDNSVFDVSLCYQKSEIRSFRFSLKGNAWASPPKANVFKYNAATAIAKAMGVSTLRLQDLQISYDINGASVVFTLLGPPPIKGDVKNPVNTISSRTAYSNFRRVLDNGSLSFSSAMNKSVPGSETHKYTGVAYSMTEVVRTDKGTIVEAVDTTQSGLDITTTSGAKVTTSTASFRSRTTVDGNTPKPSGPSTISPQPCSAENLDSSPKHEWQGGSVAGVAVGTALVGLLLGVLSTILTLKMRRGPNDMKEQLTLNQLH